MITLEDFNESTSPSRPCAFTVGSFDGVHLGHQKILQRLREKVGESGSVGVFTFSNHPTHVFPGRDPALLIATKELKLEMLEKCGVDVVYCIPFTLEFAALSYEEFLQKLMHNCPFDFLVLGQGACLGKKREGTPKRVLKLGRTLGFQSQYLEKVQEGDHVISSGKIREAILSGNLKEARALLGRPFTLLGESKNQKLVLPSHVCLPPDGEYLVTINGKNEQPITIKNQSIMFASSEADEKKHILFQ